MVVAALDYARVALDDPDGYWELHAGVMLRKPTMSFGHNDGMRELTYELMTQLDRTMFKVSRVPVQ